MIATSGSIGAVFAAGRLLHSDDGMQALVGIIYGVPLATVVGAVVAGLGSSRKPVLCGVVIAEVAWIATSAAMVAFGNALPAERPGLFVLSLISGQVFPPVAVVGAAGGHLGGMLHRRSCVASAR